MMPRAEAPCLHGRASRVLVLTLSGLVAWGSTVAAEGPLPVRWASLAARGESPAAFDRRCTQASAALGIVQDGSHPAGMFPRRALLRPTTALVQRGLGASLDFHHGSLGVTPSSSVDLVRVRRLLAEPAGWVRDAAAAEAARATPNGQASGADDGPPSASGGRGKAGAIVALVVGVGLFGFFLTRGPEKIDEMIELRGERSEIADFTLFAAAVTLIGTGAVMLIAGS